jgi:hypothetical protein
MQGRTIETPYLGKFRMVEKGGNDSVEQSHFGYIPSLEFLEQTKFNFNEDQFNFSPFSDMGV